MRLTLGWKVRPDLSQRLSAVWCHVCARFVGERQHPHEATAWPQLRLDKRVADLPLRRQELRGGCVPSDSDRSRR